MLIKQTDVNTNYALIHHVFQHARNTVQNFF